MQARITKSVVYANLTSIIPLSDLNKFNENMYLKKTGYQITNLN